MAYIWAYTGRNQCSSMSLVGPTFCFLYLVCFVSETKGQDQPEDENAAKARPELEQGETYDRDSSAGTSI